MAPYCICSAPLLIESSALHREQGATSDQRTHIDVIKHVSHYINHWPSKIEKKQLTVQCDYLKTTAG